MAFAFVRRLKDALSPAYAAALALIAIQVGIGLLYKASQTNGKYAFSASSSVTISEFFKFLLSSYFFHRDWKQRSYTAVAPSENDIKIGSLESGSNSEDGESSDRHSVYDDDFIHDKPGAGNKFDLRQFMAAYWDEVAVETRYGFAHLALFYVLMNNLIFVLFRLADPGTIQLIKSGTTLITAVVMILTLGTTIVGGQWIAIILQVCGIVVTQYGPNGAATYPFSTYIFLLGHTTLSAISSVYNQTLCKKDGSLHAMNMTLYGSGVVINFTAHWMIRFINAEEPGFLTGYGSFGACMVIVSNVFIGLAMTAVYKYADAIIKCFATAISTAILLYLSPVLFDVKFSFLVLPGTVVVFIATWLYMQSTPKPGSAPPKAHAPLTPMETDRKGSFVARVVYAFSPYGPLNRVGLGVTTSCLFFLVGMLTYYRVHVINVEVPKPVATTAPAVDMPALNATATSGFNYTESYPTTYSSSYPSATPTPSHSIFESPFGNTVAHIRLNKDIPERIDTLSEGYNPYFHTVHFSMPHEGVDVELATVDRDFWWDPQVPYPGLTHTLEALLDMDSFNDVDGILYFHFDSWIEPLSFADMDYKKMWVLDNPHAPPYLCMKDTSWDPEWQWFRYGKHEGAKKAMRKIKEKYEDEFDIDVDEFCVGWSDMFYLPRQYWRDFVKLATIFRKEMVFVEIGLPTIFNIIDRTYRLHPSRSTIHRWSDCWGGCCEKGAKRRDLEQKRCGHKLDFEDWKVSRYHFERLQENSMLLGQPLIKGAAPPTKSSSLNLDDILPQ